MDSNRRRTCRQAMALWTWILIAFLAINVSPALASQPNSPGRPEDEILRHFKQCKFPRLQLTAVCRELNDRFGAGSPTQAGGSADQPPLVISPTTAFTRPIGSPDLIRGLYITYYGLASEQLRGHVQNLLETTELNAVVMDVKSDLGYIPYSTTVKIAVEIGAARRPVIADWAAWMKWLQDQDIYTIARIVVFKDEPMAAGHPEWAVIDGETEEIWRDKENQGWTDPFREEIWDYNIALAVEAAQYGFDEIQFDYVRFPTDGQVKQAGFLNENTQENRIAAITAFVAKARQALAPYDVKLAVDSFGYTPWRISDMGIGQQIDHLMPYLDVLSPMLYPSTFADGLPGLPEYANSIAFPYEIVNKSTIKAVERAQLINPNIEIRPWIQDFPDYAFDRRTYTPDEIRLQMQGAIDAGAGGWMLWDPHVQFTAEALTPAATFAEASLEPGGQPSAPTETVSETGTPLATLTDTLPAMEAQPAQPPALAALAPATQASALPVYAPNPEGRILVLEYHRIGEPEARWRRTPDNFRADLERLLAEGYYPLNLRDLIEDNLDAVPAGKRPIVLTFDDSTAGQFRILPDGAIDPDSAAGILRDFHQQHPADWPLRATFFVLEDFTGPGPAAFGQREWAEKKLKMLVAWGMEVGSHTLTHANLRELPPEEVMRELALSKAGLEERLPGYQVVSFSVPYGAYPEDDSLLVRGVYEDVSYHYKAVVEVGGGLTPPLNSPAFNPYHIPRAQAIQSELDMWLARASRPGVYYVSAGTERQGDQGTR